MIGVDAETGRALGGTAHLRQSIRDILTTPLGGRVMLPDYGSRLFELVDRSLNAAGLAAVRAEVARAIHKWEPRVRVERVLASVTDDGAVIGLSLADADTGAPVAVPDLVVPAAGRGRAYSDAYSGAYA